MSHEREKHSVLRAKRFRRVRKRLDHWMIAQGLVHPGPLDPNPSAVNQAHLPKPCLVRGTDVLVHD